MNTHNKAETFDIICTI